MVGGGGGGDYGLWVLEFSILYLGTLCVIFGWSFFCCIFFACHKDTHKTARFRSIYCKERINWEPGAPCVKVFFFQKTEAVDERFGAYSGLKSRGLGDSATCRPGRNHWKTIVNICYEAQAACDKFFDTGHYMKKHDPSLPVGGRFYGWGLATMTGKRTQAQTTASKSGMTLTNWEV